MSSFLELYDPQDIIGNGSFGIIRKVRRKSDGLIFARKELNFERMSERDRKQIVAEVNILKDLHHDHIVRYHDRHVDRDAGILYILMEYCGGGDLSTVIKHAQKHNRPIPEDTIWNYFMQILLALQHCHHPNGGSGGHGRSGSGGAASGAGEKRPQILHRDLKPDNVFLDESNMVKLGDFGLSKALAQASFANTYVGTPYYMSPELMQEKAYDSKSDIWSLGCLIYELCALKPPFHEAKTHAELSIFIRNGRIPPLPKGYSQSLSGIIKSMLHLNPAMRPSAAQLLQHERLELVFKVSETEKMLNAVKTHKTNVVSKEREVLAREAVLADKEARIATLLAQKDAEIVALKQTMSQMQTQFQVQSQQSIDAQIRVAISRREDELRVAVAKREEEVAAVMTRREGEIIEAIRKREEELCEAWRTREEEIRKEVEEKVEWVSKWGQELKEEETKLEQLRNQLEEQIQAMEERAKAGKREKTPLEEVKNLLVPLARMTEEAHAYPSPTPTRQRPTTSQHTFPPHVYATPIGRSSNQFSGDFIASAMKGVVLTATGEPLATPSPAEFANLFVNTPKVGLNFATIFDFDEVADRKRVAETRAAEEDDESGNETASPPPSPSKNREKVKSKDVPASLAASDSSSLKPLPTRLRRPSIRSGSRRPSLTKTASLPLPTQNTESTSSSSSSSTTSINSASSQHTIKPKPLPHPHLHSASSTAASASTATSTAKTIIMPIPRSHPSPEYDEENMPSPFLKRVDRDRIPIGSASASASGTRTVARSAINKRTSNGNLLRVVAAANAVNRRGAAASIPDSDGAAGHGARPSLASARRATEEARKALLRP